MYFSEIYMFMVKQCFYYGWIPATFMFKASHSDMPMFNPAHVSHAVRLFMFKSTWSDDLPKWKHGKVLKARKGRTLDEAAGHQGTAQHPTMPWLGRKKKHRLELKVWTCRVKMLCSLAKIEVWHDLNKNKWVVFFFWCRVLSFYRYLREAYISRTRAQFQPTRKLGWG
jgi:hypothetical protein